MSKVSLFGRSLSAHTPQPRYAYRVSFGGSVRVTTDPIEVARIRCAYPSAQVQVVRVG